MSPRDLLFVAAFSTTLSGCVWFGMAMIVKYYDWREKRRK